MLEVKCSEPERHKSKTLYRYCVPVGLTQVGDRRTTQPSLGYSTFAVSSIRPRKKYPEGAPLD